MTTCGNGVSEGAGTIWPGFGVEEDCTTSTAEVAWAVGEAGLENNTQAGKKKMARSRASTFE